MKKDIELRTSSNELWTLGRSVGHSVTASKRPNEVTNERSDEQTNEVANGERTKRKRRTSERSGERTKWRTNKVANERTKWRTNEVANERSGEVVVPSLSSFVCSSVGWLLACVAWMTWFGWICVCVVPCMLWCCAGTGVWCGCLVVLSVCPSVLLSHCSFARRTLHCVMASVVV